MAAAAAAAAREWLFGGIAVTAPHALCPSVGCDTEAAPAAAALTDVLLREGAPTRRRTYVAAIPAAVARAAGTALEGAVPLIGRAVCDLNRPDCDFDRPWKPKQPVPEEIAPGRVPVYGHAEIEAALALAHASDDAALLLDVHSFMPYMTQRPACGLGMRESQCRVGWDAYPLMIGVDESNEASVGTGESLRDALRARGLMCELWSAHPTVNALIAHARRAGAAARRPYATLLLEFREPLIEGWRRLEDREHPRYADERRATRARTREYARAVGEWAIGHTRQAPVSASAALHARRVDTARAEGLLRTMLFKTSSA
jgi:hypothetical protein